MANLTSPELIRELGRRRSVPVRNAVFHRTRATVPEMQGMTEQQARVRFNTMMGDRVQSLALIDGVIDWYNANYDNPRSVVRVRGHNIDSRFITPPAIGLAVVAAGGLARLVGANMDEGLAENIVNAGSEAVMAVGGPMSAATIALSYINRNIAASVRDASLFLGASAFAYFLSGDLDKSGHETVAKGVSLVALGGMIPAGIGSYWRRDRENRR